MINQNSSVSELLVVLEKRLAENKVKDAVHKIKFMTARDVIHELLDEH